MKKVGKIIFIALRPLFLLLTVTLSKAGIAQLVLYDDFASERIDPAKWTGWNNFDPDVREAVRQLTGDKEDRHLHLSLTAYSATTDDFGGSGGPYGLAFLFQVPLPRLRSPGL